MKQCKWQISFVLHYTMGKLGTKLLPLFNIFPFVGLNLGRVGYFAMPRKHLLVFIPLKSIIKSGSYSADFQNWKFFNCSSKTSIHKWYIEYPRTRFAPPPPEVNMNRFSTSTGCPKKNWDFVQFWVFGLGRGVFRGKN